MAFKRSQLVTKAYTVFQEVGVTFRGLIYDSGGYSGFQELTECFRRLY